MNGLRILNVRYDVLRDNSKVTELTPVSSGSIQANYSSDIKSSLSVEVMDNSLVDWYKDEIQPVIELDGTEYKMGVFAPATIEYKTDEFSTKVSVEAYDRCWRLAVSASDTIEYAASGTNYIDYIKTLLARAGIGLANIVPTDYTMATDREDWDLGTDSLTIVNELLAEIGYSAIWFDGNGYAMLQPAPSKVEDAYKTYDCDNASSLMLSNMSTSYDLYNAPNVFIVSCANPELTADLMSRAENTNPLSNLSIQRRGIEIYSFESVNNIPNQTALDEYAQLKCFNSMLSNETVSLETMIYPDVTMNSMVYVRTPSASGVYLETGWTIDLEPGGTMTHSLRRFIQ